MMAREKLVRGPAIEILPISSLLTSRYPLLNFEAFSIVIVPIAAKMSTPPERRVKIMAKRRSFQSVAYVALHPNFLATLAWANSWIPKMKERKSRLKMKLLKATSIGRSQKPL